MLINRLISSLALGATLLAAGAALPAMARGYDDGYRGQWRGDDYRHDEWRHRHHWRHHDRHFYPGAPIIYQREYVQPRVYYPPVYVAPQPREGVTIIYRNHW
jgi:hypothetical protein